MRVKRIGAAAVIVCSIALCTLTYAQSSGSDNWFWSSLYRFSGAREPESARQLSAEIASSEIASSESTRRSSHSLRHWNQVSIDASGLDHTPIAPGEARVFGEQLGPGRASRAVAIMHIAVHDAINAIVGRYRTYTGLRRTFARASVDAAIAQAAHDTLVAVFPSQSAHFDEELASELARVPEHPTKTAGIEVGRRAAAAILAHSADDGSNYKEPRIGEGYIPGDEPGVWRQDPISQLPVALGAKWGDVRPFVLRSGAQFRAPAPPDMDSWRYLIAFNEVKRLGGDGVATPTRRTPQQTFIGIFWAYDGTPSLCAPPRLYNQIAMTIADQEGTSRDVVELARLLALVNVAMSDAGVAVWESKFYYKFWRPVGGVREASNGSGPTGEGDGNPNTIGDPTFSPLGAPASNLIGPDFTPPFPSYPSGHAGFGGALFQTLRRFYGTDRIAFRFVSDEFNGTTRANDGSVRPLMPRRFSSLSQAEEENGQSRIYLGIHWEFDKTEGIRQGRRVANYIYDRAFQRAR